MADTAVTTAQTAADAAAVVAATAADAAAVVAATAEAVTKTTAIKAEADDLAAAVAGLPANVMMDISRDRTATTIEIEDSGAAEGDPEFALYKDLGKGRTMHTRKMEADADGDVVEEVIVVSTDIAAPRAVAFAKYESDAMECATQVLNFNTDMMNDDAGENEDGETFEALMFAALVVGDDTAGVLALIKSDEFEPAQGTTVTHTFASALAATQDTPGCRSLRNRRHLQRLNGHLPV